MKICTDPSEIKPLLNGGLNASKSVKDSSRCDGGENSETNSLRNSVSSQVTSPTLCELKNLKSGQYSALFETACEIEYYTCHKNILPPEASAEKRTSKRDKKKGNKLKDGVIKCHSATSSPIRRSPERRHEKDRSIGSKSASANGKKKTDQSEWEVSEIGCTATATTTSTSSPLTKGEEKSKDEESPSKTKTKEIPPSAESREVTGKDDNSAHSNSNPRQSSKSGTDLEERYDGEGKETWREPIVKEESSCDENESQKTCQDSSESKQVIETTC